MTQRKELEEQTEQLTDEQIIKGFRELNEKITKKYFYSYCKAGYALYDYLYKLRGKDGLDFMTLAHDYYLSLYSHDWKDLDSKRLGVSLKTWMIGGFRFVVLDALKKYNKTHQDKENEYNKGLGKMETTPDDPQRQEMVELLQGISQTVYADDPRAQQIIDLIYIQGYKQNEAAREMGITPSAVNQRVKALNDQLVDLIRGYRRGRMFDYTCDGMAEPKDVTISRPEPPQAVEKYAESSRKPAARRRHHRHGRVSADRITKLNEGEVFVFGSNRAGYHGSGASWQALHKFGARMGQGSGYCGQSYAIPTMQGDVETIAPYVDKFIEFAKAHPELKFLVTRVGCGVAGFEPSDIAPLFVQAVDVDNILLPEAFWDVLEYE